MYMHMELCLLTRVIIDSVWWKIGQKSCSNCQFTNIILCVEMMSILIRAHAAI